VPEKLVHVGVDVSSGVTITRPGRAPVEPEEEEDEDEEEDDLDEDDVGVLLDPSSSSPPSLRALIVQPTSIATIETGRRKPTSFVFMRTPMSTGRACRGRRKNDGVSCGTASLPTLGPPCAALRRVTGDAAAL